MTIAEVKRALVSELSELLQGNETYSVTRMILEHFGYSEIQILKDPAAIVDANIQAEIKKIVIELHKNRPIQYILGETIFYELSFIVSEGVLIPRPETEELVSNIILENSYTTPSILDIGTGSGCIAVTLAKFLPGSKVTAMDIEEAALKIARTNARKNHAEVRFLNQSIISAEHNMKTEPFDIIVSNPPYILESEKNLMMPNVLNFEPVSALFVPDNDPFIFYREIIRYSEKGLSKKGVIWTEINEEYGSELKDLFIKSGFRSVRILKDIHGKERFIKATDRNG